jgi:hypothetical protein
MYYVLSNEGELFEIRCDKCSRLISFCDKKHTSDADPCRRFVPWGHVRVNDNIRGPTTI